jgi:hypothetical protein
LKMFEHTYVVDHMCTPYLPKSNCCIKSGSVYLSHHHCESPFIWNTELQIFFGWGGGGRCDPARVMASSFLRFLDHTQRRSTVARTPLDEWSARRRDLYLTIYNNHNRQTSMPPVEFEPTISGGKRPQTYALDRAATATGTELRFMQYKHQITIYPPQFLT